MTSFDASAETVNLSIDQGDTEVFAITRQQSDGTAQDITGWTFWLTVKEELSDTDGDAVVQKTVTSHTDAVNGETELRLDASDTDPLAGRYRYDIQEKTAGGNVNTIMYGTLYVRTDVTESTT